MVLAASATITPIKVQMLTVYDALFLVVASLIVYVLAKSKFQISRGEGLVMLGMYAGYMVYIVAR